MKVKRYNASNPKSHQKFLLNSSIEINKLKKSIFESVPEAKKAFRKTESAAANVTNMGLVYRLDDDKRSLKNHKTSIEVAKKLDLELPKPIELVVPEAKGKRKDPYMLHEWDYDFCGPLVDTYGTNYKAMSRDLKRNYRQKSEGELRRLCERYVEFKTFGETKLEEYLEEEKKVRQGTILGAPHATTDMDTTDTNKTTATTTPTTTTPTPTKNENKGKATAEPTTNNKDNTKSKRKRDDNEKKVVEEEENAKVRKVNAKKGKEATNAATKGVKGQQTNDKTTTTITTTTPEAKPKAKETKTKETKTKTITAKPTATKITTAKPTATKTTTEATKEKQPKNTPAPAHAPAPTKITTKTGKKPAAKMGGDSDDSELDGLEFDFDENDNSSDDE